MVKNNAQVSFEYLILVGFITFFVISVLGIALVYSSSIRDEIRMSQLINFANKVISTAESVFYSGEPSRATVIVYIPEGIKDINITGNDMVVEIQISSGTPVIAFSSNVPLSGSIRTEPGLEKITIIAHQNYANITRV